MILISLILFASLLLVASGWGIRVSLWLGVTYTSRIECAAFTVGLGFAVLIGIGFALGAVGWLTQPAIFVSLILLSITALPAIRRADRIIVPVSHPPSTYPDLRFIRYAMWIFLAALLLLNLIGALSPDTIWDANSYHLFLPKQWLKAGQLVLIPDNFYSTWPLNLSILYAVEMSLINDSILPQLTHFSLGILSMLLIYSFVRPRYGGLAATCAGVIFYSIPVMTWLSGTAISDLGIAYFTLWAVVGYLRWIEGDHPAWLRMAAIGTGLAMGAKLTGLFTLAILAIATIYVGWIKRIRIKRIVLHVFIVSLIAGGLALPWYLKSYVQTGNPIFPFGYNVFGGKYWNDVVNTDFLAAQFGAMGIQRRVVDFVLLPLRLLIPQHNPYEGPISWIFLAGVVWGLFQRRDRTVGYLTYFSVTFFVFWMLFTSQVIRMLLPTLGALSIVAAVGLARLTRRYKLGIPVVIVIMIAQMAEGVIGLWRERSSILADQVAVVLGQQSRQTYLLNHLEPADVLLYANENLPSDGAILAVGEVRGFLSKHQFIWDQPAYIDYNQLKDPVALRQRLTDLNIQYVLVRGADVTFDLQMIEPDLELIYKSGQYLLYRWDRDRILVSDHCYSTSANQQSCVTGSNPEKMLGEILPGTKYFQTFTSECAGLNQIDLFLTAYGRTNKGTLSVRLKDLDSQQQIFDVTIPAAEIANNQWRVVPFDHLLDSKGKHYRITLTSADALRGSAVGIWRSAKDMYSGGEASINDKPIRGDWVFQYACGN